MNPLLDYPILTETISLEAYQAHAEAFWQAETRALWQASAGLNSEVDLTGVYQEYGGLFDRDSVTSLVQSLEREGGVRSLASFAAFRYLQGKVAEKDDELFGQMAQRTVQIDGQEYPFFAADRLLMNESHAGRRRSLYESRREAVAVDNPLRAARWSELHQQARELGFSSYKDLCDRLKGLRLNDLYWMASEILNRTERAYITRLEKMRKKFLGGEPMQSADVYFLLRGKQYDSLFPPEELEDALFAAARGLGFELTSQTALEIDTKPRPGKMPRPFTAYVQVPDEIKLVVSPVGGYSDYRYSLHELGHSLFGISIDRHLPFSNRYLGDDTVGEMFAFLFENLVRSSEWMLGRRYEIQSFRYLDHMAFIQMVNVRRTAAKLMYEIEFHSGMLQDPAQRYSDLLTHHLKVFIPPDFYLLDMDDGFYSAQYVRAWILEAQLRAYLLNQFGPHWFDHPETGYFLRKLWHAGQPEQAEDLGVSMGYSGLNIDYLVKDLNTGLEN